MPSRFIAGLGVGAMSAIVPLYNGETAPKAIRGTLIVLYQLQIITGYGLFQVSRPSLTEFCQYFHKLCDRSSYPQHTEFCVLEGAFSKHIYIYFCSASLSSNCSGSRWPSNGVGFILDCRVLIPPRFPVSFHVVRALSTRLIYGTTIVDTC